MKPVVLDTSGLISFISLSDSNHEIALGVNQSLKEKNQPVILPGEIFTETINVIGKKIDHQTSLATANLILTSNQFAIIDTTPQIRESALEKFAHQPASVSYTDCLVMAFADFYQTKYIFGFDKVFAKNKYCRLGLD